MDMETLGKLQDDLKDKIAKGLSNFKKSPKDRVTKSYIETRLETLENQWITFIDTHRQIITEVEEDDLKISSYHRNSIYDLTENLFIDYKSELKQSLLSFKNENQAISQQNEISRNVNQNLTNCSFRLPKISIPKFSGSYAEWVTFRDLYTSLIHNNVTLDDVHKLHYLKSHLAGEAEQLLRHIPISSDNYAISWKKLCDRYNNKRYLSNNIFKRLFSQRVLQSESSSGIRELLDTMCDCLSALDNLGVSTKGWDAIVIFLMSQKLDPDTRKQWELKSNESHNELPTFESFKEFLEHKFRSLEFLDIKSKARPNQKNVHVHNVNVNDSNANIQNVSTVSTSSLVCPRCKGDHKLLNCKQFCKEDYTTRHNFVQTNRLCFNCLGSNHSVYVCRQSFRCRICKRKHHSLLHPPNVSQSKPTASGSGLSVTPNNVVVSTVTESQDVSTDNVITTCFSTVPHQVLLATALTKAEMRSGDDVIIRCLLDQGSQASFVTESVVQMLRLKKVPNQIFISGVGSDGTNTVSSKYSVTIRLKSIHNPTYSVEVKAHVLSKLTRCIPSKKVSVGLWSGLSDLKLADPKFDTPNKIDMLIGAEVYGQILEDGIIKGPPGSPIAQNTKFGWILSGRIQSDENSDMCLGSEVVSMHIQAVDDTNELLKKFWEVEGDTFSKKEKRILTTDEERCEEIFRQTTTRDETGRYIVKLPFRNEDPQCKYGEFQEIATRRLNYLERRLNKNLELKNQYSEVMKEYIDLEHMELVPEEEKDNKHAVYLPHHAVVRADKSTTKVRVVFDASASGNNGVSLNDDLIVGPTLQPDLRNIIMRWRQHSICLIGDIIKMYRQVKMKEEDVDFQRILWRDEAGDLQHYRLLRVTFGTASAPYLAVRALQQVAYDEGEGFEELMLPSETNNKENNKIAKDIAEKIISDFYMDDLMTGCSTLDEGLKIYKGISEILRRGGFELQKWISNDKELLEILGELKKDQDLTRKSVELGSGKTGDEIRKVLGVTWNNVTDEIEYSVKLPEVSDPVTKRKVVSDICKLFDPLGWIAPVIIRAKILIQDIWISGINWDDELPPNLLREWITYREDLQQLTKFCIPRWTHTYPHDEVELHGYSDASNKAFSAVVYIRTIGSNGEVNVTLVTSKTKVAPIKQISIPRLELCGAGLLAKLLFEVSEILNIPKKNVHAWTDSSIVLAWLSSHPSRWKTFVANRVTEIITLYDRSHWSHVRSNDNPADCASRGVKPSELADLTLWKFGPTWLRDSNIKYSPLEDDSQVGDVTSEERSKVKSCCTTTIHDDDTQRIFSKFSSLIKLTRVLTYCRRFIKLKCSKIKPSFPRWLTSVELQQTLMLCIRKCQGQYFAQEIHDVQGNGNVSSKSKLYSLSPFLDGEGILRVGGRLEQSDLNYNAKHPILIPDESHIAVLIIADAHNKTLHGGPQSMISYIRTKYWLVRLKNKVKGFVRKCVTCLRHAPKIIHPLMGQLPSARVTACRAFKFSGADYAGPFAIRTTKGRGHHATKGYICLFICMATRAIHLEVVSDMTSEGFIAAFKRFVARRGHCVELWSDNGTNFVGAARELKTLLIDERSTVAAEIADWLATNGTHWRRIPPHSPNFGGLWESGIRSTKHHLKRIIGTTTLTFEELTTVLAQIEACLNSRPISQLSDDIHDTVPLTPGHFLVGEPLLLVPDANYEKSNISPLKRWQLTQKMVQEFWRRWSGEYLVQFFRRYKWNKQTLEPKIGDVVLVMEDDLPPARWLYGVIVDKHPGLDKVTRVVSLRCKDSVIKRPVSKLCVLPITD